MKLQPEISLNDTTELLSEGKHAEDKITGLWLKAKVDQLKIPCEIFRVKISLSTSWDRCQSTGEENIIHNQFRINSNSSSFGRLWNFNKKYVGWFHYYHLGVKPHPYCIKYPLGWTNNSPGASLTILYGSTSFPGNPGGTVSSYSHLSATFSKETLDWTHQALPLKRPYNLPPLSLHNVWHCLFSTIIIITIKSEELKHILACFMEI